jgi:hypothetical protein
MKVIISENQLKKNPKAIKALVDEVGLDVAADMLGMSKLKVILVLGYDISFLGIDDWFTLMVEDNNLYERSEITVDYFDVGYGVYWVYEEDIDGGKINVISIAKPEFDEGKVFVDNSHSFVEGGIVGFRDFNNGIEYKVEMTNYIIPSHFESLDVMIKWYNTEYLPDTYEIIKGQAKEIIEQLKQNNKI